MSKGSIRWSGSLRTVIVKKIFAGDQRSVIYEDCRLFNVLRKPITRDGACSITADLLAASVP